MHKHNLIRTFSQLSMLLVIPGLTACSGDDLTGSGTNNDIEANPGIVAHKNFTVASSDPFPKVWDPTKGFTETSVEIVVKIGDLNNQLLTDQHTVFFKTEWGLIEPSCTTIDGKCSVTWQTSKFENIPLDLLNTVTAWTEGEESFTDTNGNGKFDDADVNWDDLEEPFVDVNTADGDFNPTAGDLIIDVVNSADPTGVNEEHDDRDSWLNSPNCTTSLSCSIDYVTIFVWSDTELNLAGPPSAP